MIPKYINRMPEPTPPGEMLDWSSEAPMSPRRVILESPYAASTVSGIQANIRYAQLALRDSLLRGEAPLASHLLYTRPGVFRDEVPEERARGTEAGFSWMRFAEAVVVYGDRGVSAGMREGIRRAEELRILVEFRGLSQEALEVEREWLCLELAKRPASG